MPPLHLKEFPHAILKIAAFSDGDTGGAADVRRLTTAAMKGLGIKLKLIFSVDSACSACSICANSY